MGILKDVDRFSLLRSYASRLKEDVAVRLELINAGRKREVPLYFHRRTIPVSVGAALLLSNGQY